MNPNDIFAQQQTALNQLAQNGQHLIFGIMAVQLAFFILVCWVIYLFYARLRDIANELMKFRIAYEFAQERDASARLPSKTPSTPSLSVHHTSKPADAKYMPT